MRRLRLLVVLATTFMVAFTGMSTASAHSMSSRAPEIVRVSDAYAGSDRPDTLKIKLSYKCFTAKGDNERDRLSVTLKQKGEDREADAVYTGDAGARCNGHDQEKWVELHRVRWAHGEQLGFAHNGPASVEVVLKQVTDRQGKRDDVQIQKESFTTGVKGAGDGPRHP
jgi:hypothetical protein